MIDWHTHPKKVWLDEHVIDVWYVRLPCQYPTSEYWHVLSRDEQERANRFYFNHLKENFIWARGILRMLLSQYIPIQPIDIVFNYTPHGKPYLIETQNPDAISFSISHSGECVLYAVTKKASVGIDVEFMKEIDFAGIAKRFFSQYEYNSLLKAHESTQKQLFYTIWTCKEAFVKAVGLGLSYPLEDFDVAISSEHSPRIIQIKGDHEAAKAWRVVSFKPGEEYSGALVSNNLGGEVNFWEWA